MQTSRGKILDFNIDSKGFELLVDVGKSQPVCSITMLYPNETTVTIRGDEDVVRQIVERLDGQVIEYAPPKQEVEL